MMLGAKIVKLKKTKHVAFYLLLQGYNQMSYRCTFQKSKEEQIKNNFSYSNSV